MNEAQHSDKNWEASADGMNSIRREGKQKIKKLVDEKVKEEAQKIKKNKKRSNTSEKPQSSTHKTGNPPTPERIKA